MKCLNSLFDSKIEEATAITVGKFDGMHRGHRILASNIKSKKSSGLASCIVTFVNSPRLALNKDSTPCLITNRERELMLESEEIDYVVECPFDKKMMETSAEDFVRFLYENLNMRYMTVGSDFHFGYKGSGDATLLEKLSKSLGFELEVVEKIKKEDRDISSTYIREELIAGRIENVNEMLGYEYFVWGEVVHGAHLGHKIGIPTINITPGPQKLVPKFGVYITTIDLEGRVYHGVTNVGMKPTVTDQALVGIETHILDYTGDLYGKDVKVTFKKFLRPEQKFENILQLTNQMNVDKNEAKKFFNS